MKSSCIFSPRFATLIHLGLLFVLLACVYCQARANDQDDFMFAVKFNDVTTVKALLDRGMDVNLAEPTRGETVLMIALREKSMKVFKALLTHKGIELEARARNGDTALMIASFLGNLDAVSQLVAAGAQVNRPGWAALHYAAASGDTEIVAFLLEHAAYIDAQSPNKTTPLMMAVNSRKLAAATLLLDEGADLTVKNAAGMSVMDFAVHHEYREIIKFLSDRINQGQKRP
jgi:ankyrin repeat protein